MRSLRFALLLAFTAGLARAEEPAPKDAPASSCKVAHRAEARRNGPMWRHVVKLINSCEKPQACTVTTDASKESFSATVPGKGETEVVTFAMSPVTGFKATVDCAEAK